MVNATLYVTSEAFTVKPKGYKIAQIQKSILNDKVVLEPEQLAEMVAVQGKACKLCNLPEGSLNSKKTPIINQSILMLDIDNENKDVDLFLPTDVWKDDFLTQNAAFMYETFSSTVEKPKFRIVFFLKTPFTENHLVEDTYDWLIKKYPQSDSKCRETTRLFFGSTKGYTPINMGNLWEPEIEYKKSSSISRGRTKKKELTSFKNIYKPILTNNLENVYTLITQKDMDSIRDKIKEKDLGYYGMEFDSLEDFKQFILTDEDVSMVDILDLPSSNPFLDIFHDESEPSVGIFRTDNGVELYNCFSVSHAFTGNILQVISKLMVTDNFASLLLLKEILSIKIKNNKEYSNLPQIRNDISSFRLKLKDGKLEKTFPNLHKVFSKYDITIYYILDEFLEGNVYFNPVKKQYEIYNQISITNLHRKLRDGVYGNRISLRTLQRILTLLTLCNIVSKKTDAEMPKWMLQIATKHQNVQKQNYRFEVYSLEPVSRYKLTKIDKICEKLLTENVRITELDYDYIYNTFNKGIADRTFLSNTDEKRDVSNKIQYIEKTATKIIMNQLKKKNYVEFKYIVNRLLSNINRNTNLPSISYKDAENSLVKCQTSICDKYGLVVLSLTKSNQEKYKIKDVPKGKRPKVFVLDN